MNGTRRVTANLPVDLLEQATRASGKGITETLVAGLDRALRHVRVGRRNGKPLAAERGSQLPHAEPVRGIGPDRGQVRKHVLKLGSLRVVEPPAQQLRGDDHRKV